MKGWQFDKLTIEEKILKWSNRNPDKELVIEIYESLILKKVKEIKKDSFLLLRQKFQKVMK